MPDAEDAGEVVQVGARRRVCAEERGDADLFAGRGRRVVVRDVAELVDELRVLGVVRLLEERGDLGGVVHQLLAARHAVLLEVVSGRQLMCAG